LTSITGFFGQNFAWLTDRIGGLAQFLALGIGLLVALTIGFMVWFRRRGYL
jgi:magnesium transporter